MSADNRLFRSISRTLLVISVLLLTVAAHARSWRIADFRSTMDVSDNGSTVVVERISLVFIGAWHGIYRTIPVEYPGPRGTNYTLFLSVTGVRDGDGSPLKYELSRKRAYRQIKVYIPGATDTTKVVEIDYAVKNPIRFFPD